MSIVGFHHGFSFLFSTQGAETVATNSLQVDFGGNWWTGAALVAILAHVYIFYGFEAAGDVAEETVDASRQVPQRALCLYGGRLLLVASLLLATPSSPKGYAAATSFAGGIPLILSQLPQWLQDFFLVMVIIAFFSCGTAVQGAGARLAFSYARDGAVPGSSWVRKISPRFHTPTNALIVGALVPVLFTLLVNINPSKDVHILWFTFPAGINALTALVSFGVSGIYLSFLLTVIGSMIARSRGWVPEGAFRLGRWAWLVSVLAAGYLGFMLVNVLAPTGLGSPRGALFNLDWITLVVMLVIVIVGAVLLPSRPTGSASAHTGRPRRSPLARTENQVSSDVEVGGQPPTLPSLRVHRQPGDVLACWLKPGDAGTRRSGLGTTGSWGSARRRRGSQGVSRMVRSWSPRRGPSITVTQVGDQASLIPRSAVPQKSRAVIHPQ